MIERREYRGALKEDGCEKELKIVLNQVEERAEGLVQTGSLLSVSLYRFRKMCFLYCEAEGDPPQPESIFPMLIPFLELWPEEAGKLCWAPMYPVYYHCIPKEPESWMGGRKGKERIGRIAFLKEEKLTSYVYWHKALVEEGLFCGDQYQFISLHENVLFSYYEEPKTMANIRGIKEPSAVIEQWEKQNPKGHFYREKTGGENFYVMKKLLSAGKEGPDGL